MNPFKYDVSFRIRHPKMGPEEICNTLGMAARFKWAAGAPRKTQKGAPLKGIYDSTYCCFELERPKDISLAEFLGRFNKTLGAHKEFLKHIRSTGGSSEYFIGWYSDGNSGELFRSDLLQELADLKIDLGLDVYADTASLRKPSRKTTRTGKKKKPKAKRKK